MVDAREYHERTNHSPQSVREDARRLDPRTKPRPFKAYRGLPTEPLDAIRAPAQPALAAVASGDADPLAGAEQSAPEGLDREAIATLCYEAAGIVQRVRTRDGRELPFRAASATGNLHHVDCYLVRGDCEGAADERLPAGVYHFDPTTFALDVLREGDYRAPLAVAAGQECSPHDVLGGTAGDAETPIEERSAAAVARAPVTVVVTSTWARNAWKYRERTYRHAFWDAGTILANLLATAHALDRRAEVVASFADDQVAALLGVDPEREAPIALAPVGAAEPPTESPPVVPIDPAIDPPTDEPVDTAAIHDAWQQSRLADGAAADEFRRACLERGPIGTAADSTSADAASDVADRDAVELEPVDPETASARPLHATIQRRGSCREYAEEGPTRRQVATVLDRALRGVPADWNGGGWASDADRADWDGLAYNDAYLLATGVDGLADGAYRLAPDRRTLHRVGDVDAAAKTHLALDQDWAGDAHANVYLLADVDAVVDQLGNRGYRLAQLEAGIALGRLYLATYAHRDLGGTGLTFYDGLVAERLAPEGAGQTPSERGSEDSSSASLTTTPTCLFAFGRRAD